MFHDNHANVVTTFVSLVHIGFGFSEFGLYRGAYGEGKDDTGIMFIPLPKPVLLTEVPQGPKAKREKMTQVYV